MDQKEIDVLLTHLPHELTMLEYSLEQVNALADDTTSSAADPRRITAFECFWLHARNLIEFFNTTSPNANVVSPSIFTNRDIVYEMGSETLMNRINEQISHLQRDRGLSTELPLKGADMIVVKEKIDRAVGLFQSNLKEQAKEWWKPRIRAVVLYVSTFAETACSEITTAHLDVRRWRAAMASTPICCSPGDDEDMR